MALGGEGGGGAHDQPAEEVSHNGSQVQEPALDTMMS